MYRVFALTAAALACVALPATEAQAFGDTCFRDVRAQGSVQGSMRAARGAAIAAWENAAGRKHGTRFADWYYSGDRTIECKWDASGKRIQCVATAQPCGRKR